MEFLLAFWETILYENNCNYHSYKLKQIYLKFTSLIFDAVLYKPRKRIKFSRSKWFGSEKHFSFLFIATITKEFFYMLLLFVDNFIIQLHLVSWHMLLTRIFRLAYKNSERNFERHYNLNIRHRALTKYDIRAPLREFFEMFVLNAWFVKQNNISLCKRWLLHYSCTILQYVPHFSYFSIMPLVWSKIWETRNIFATYH